MSFVSAASSHLTLGPHHSSKQIHKDVIPHQIKRSGETSISHMRWSVIKKINYVLG